MATKGEVRLGDKVKDTITGFTGIVVSVTDWLNGCQRIQVQPQELKDGKPIDQFVFDVEQLAVVEAKEKPPLKLRRVTGGDRPTVARAKDPQR